MNDQTDKLLLILNVGQNIFNCYFSNRLQIMPIFVQFCQPGGWELTERRQEPTYFVSVLTDIDGERHYCACLTFYEPYDDQRADSADNLETMHNDMVHHSIMFAPKSIVLISQLDYFDTFKVCVWAGRSPSGSDSSISPGYMSVVRDLL